MERVEIEVKSNPQDSVAIRKVRDLSLSLTLTHPGPAGGTHGMRQDRGQIQPAGLGRYTEGT